MRADSLNAVLKIKGSVTNANDYQLSPTPFIFRYAGHPR